MKNMELTFDDVQQKAERYGTDSLSDAELLSLLTGSKDKAEKFLTEFGGLVGAVKEDVNVLQYQGASKDEALKFGAVSLLADRIYYAKNFDDDIRFTSPEDVNAYMAPRLRHLSKEVFYIVCLDNTKKLIKCVKISEGGKTATIVDVAEIMKHAVINDANSIVLVHNHPSGNKKASSADIQLTKRVVEAGKLFGIPVEDHVIVAGHAFVSLRSDGMM